MSEAIKAELVALVPRLRRFAYAISGNREEGDDIVQSACLKALSRLDQYQPGTRLDSWMFRIIQTTYLDTVRTRSRRGPHAGEEALDHLSDNGRDAGQTEDRLMLAKVQQGIASLPDDQRVVLVLIAIEGFSYKEAASVLSVPIGTVMSRLARARAKLIPELQQGMA